MLPWNACIWSQPAARTLSWIYKQMQRLLFQSNYWPSRYRSSFVSLHQAKKATVVWKRLLILTLFKPGFFWLSVTGGVDSTPPENNVTVDLGRWNLAHVCTCQKTTPVPNLVAIARLVTSLWRHQCFFDSNIEGFAYVCKLSFISLWKLCWYFYLTFWNARMLFITF